MVFYLNLTIFQKQELVTAYSAIAGKIFTEESLKSEIDKIKLNFKNNRYGYEQSHTLYRWNSFKKLAQALLQTLNKYIPIKSSSPTLIKIA